MLLLFPVKFIIAQEISVKANNTALNEVLINISTHNNVSFSFDDKLLSDIFITADQSFPSVDVALEYLLQGKDLQYEKSADVWIIFPVVLPKLQYISGNVRDSRSEEALPYAHVFVDGWPIITDISGNFSFSGYSEDTILNIMVSHLGYYILDTLLKPAPGLTINLIPSSVGLTEIEIKGKTVETKTQFGNQPGLMKLNHKIAHFLPGYGDNSVFNLIRLMPGILASGEQTSEIIIWGSYEGQSEVVFDGFTVFGLKNFNDNISPFNPLLAKEIEIHKGGFDANYGGRVGGIVNIIGKNGSINKPAITFTINNMTLNGLVEIPVTKRSSLLFSLRHTYYNLYNPSSLNALIDRSISADSMAEVDITVYPDYMFRDVNIKYSSTFKNNDLFYISLHGADDRFSYDVSEQIDNRQLLANAREKNQQLGGSVYYGHNWNNGNITDIRASYSSLNSQYFDEGKVVFNPTENVKYLTNKTSDNKLEEYTVSVTNRLSLRNIHLIDAGLVFKQNNVLLDEYSFGQKVSYSNKSNNRITLTFQDRITPIKSFSLRVGMRITHIPGIVNVFVEPRFGATYMINGSWKLVAAIGVYNQYITLTTTTDELGKFRYMWTICDNEEIPVIESLHYVLGTKFQNNGYTFNVEGYYKTISGLSRYYNLVNYNVQDIFYGNATSYGVDILFKREFRKHSAWIAYSVAKTTETFNYNGSSVTRRAPQDQRHEVKAALMLNFNPVFFSTNYIYGSGFPYSNGIDNKDDIKRYSRLDASLIYKLIDRKVKGEVGISFLNILNTKNIKYQSFVKIPSSQTNHINIQTEAIPFTPTLYLKFMI